MEISAVSSWEFRLHRALDAPLKRTGTSDSCYGYHMFQLSRTEARSNFKDLLGQANHFLITILVGLDGVRSGSVAINEDFRTSWNPKSVVRSAERTRSFALDLALVRAVDAFDTYLMNSRRQPFSLTSEQFAADMDGAGQSVARRFAVFENHLDPLPSYLSVFVRLAIDWRNRRVHSLADDGLTQADKQILLDNSARLGEMFAGLGAEQLIADYSAAQGPTFKEASAVIRLMHVAVAHFDDQLLLGLDIERYTKEALKSYLSGTGRVESGLRKSACIAIWGSKNKKTQKVLRSLNMIGIHRVEEISARAVPDSFVEDILGLDPDKALIFLKEAPPDHSEEQSISICCLCGKDIEPTQDDPSTLRLRTKRGASNTLKCHNICYDRTIINLT